jgi:hypothetical protein
VIHQNVSVLRGENNLCKAAYLHKFIYGYAYNENAYCITERHVSGMIINSFVLNIMKVHIVSPCGMFGERTKINYLTRGRGIGNAGQKLILDIGNADQ